MKIQLPLSFTLALCLGLAAQGFSQTQIIEGLNHPESVALDGEMLYVADIGKEMEPMKKDGDGVISIYTKAGKLVKADFITGIDAPKGLAIQGNTLVVCDVDQLRVFDKMTGKLTKTISFEGVKTKFLNDFVFTATNVGYISATDIGMVYQVFMESGQMNPVTTSEKLMGPNGLAFNAKTNTLVVNEFGGPNGEPGRVVAIDLKTGKAKVLKGIQGGLDGMAVTKDGYLVSDWGKMPNGRVAWMGTAAAAGNKDVTTKAIGGPADFDVDAASNTIYLPAMLEGKVYTVGY